MLHTAALDLSIWLRRRAAGCPVGDATALQRLAVVAALGVGRAALLHEQQATTWVWQSRSACGPPTGGASSSSGVPARGSHRESAVAVVAAAPATGA
jgi:hypothetical protein